MLREYLEAMEALWTGEEASYEGEFVNFGPSWAWPKPVQAHIPVLVGAAGTEKNLSGSPAAPTAGSPRRATSSDEPVTLLQDTWGRQRAATERLGSWPWASSPTPTNWPAGANWA